MATIGNGAIVVRSGPDYGAWKRGKPAGAVIHCLQCPGNVNVRSLAGPGSYTDNQGVSPHTMSDQTKVVEILGPDRSGAHVGAGGNPFLWGAEVTGYAEWTNAQWWDNAKAVLNQAKAVGSMWRFHGFNVADLRWGSVPELIEARKRYDAGLPPVAPRLWIHWDLAKAGKLWAPLRGTDHWDVGNGFLFDEFPGWCREWVTGAGTGGGGGGRPEGGTGGGNAGADPADPLDFIWGVSA